MPITSVAINFGLFDTTMKADSTVAISEKQPFCSVDDLKLNFLRTKKYSTLEPDSWRADGTFSTLADDITSGIGLWSATQSDASGVFVAPVILTITFGSLHTTKGVTLDMSPYENWCNDLNIKWYNGASLLSNLNFFPDEALYVCNNLVTGFNKLVITFNKTNMPYRYLKLKRIIYGEEVNWGPDEIVSVSVLEEVNPISAEITINTLNFQLHSDNADFSILNPQGIYTALQKLQPMSVIGTVDGVDLDYGTFYLTEWQNITETQITMSAVDMVGLMDKTMFKGDIYNAVQAGTIINAIMTSAGLPYNLDASISTVPLTGWIPYSTHREALQQVCFALGAMVDTSRDVYVNIKANPTTAATHLTLEEKFTGGKVTLLPIVTGIELTEHNYVASTEAVNLYTGSLSAGTYTVFFSNPAHTLTVSGAVIASSGANHAVLTVSTTGVVTLNGKAYKDTPVIITKDNPLITATDPKNVLKIETAYLVSSSNSAAVIQKAYDYYQNRVKQEFSTIYTDDRTGTQVEIDTIYETTKTAIIESLEINLTGGFVQKVVAVGA